MEIIAHMREFLNEKPIHPQNQEIDSFIRVPYVLHLVTPCAILAILFFLVSYECSAL